MATYIVPLTSDARQSMEVTLNGVTLSLVVRWNTEAEGWYVDAYQPDGTAIVIGRRLVTMHSIWSRRTYLEALPVGDLYCVELTGSLAEPGRTAWTDATHQLVWVDG